MAHAVTHLLLHLPHLLPLVLLLLAHCRRRRHRPHYRPQQVHREEQIEAIQITALFAISSFAIKIRKCFWNWGFANAISWSPSFALSKSNLAHSARRSLVLWARKVEERFLETLIIQSMRNTALFIASVARFCNRFSRQFRRPDVGRYSAGTQQELVSKPCELRLRWWSTLNNSRIY